MGLHLLLDENAESKWFTNLLTKAGHDVLRVKDLVPKGTGDREILALAKKKNCILYTRDRDFLELHANSQTHNGIIFEFRTGTSSDMTYAEIIGALAKIEAQYQNFRGLLIIINSFRKRTL